MSFEQENTRLSRSVVSRTGISMGCRLNKKTHDCQGRSLVEWVFQCEVIWTRKHMIFKVGKHTIVKVGHYKNRYFNGMSFEQENTRLARSVVSRMGISVWCHLNKKTHDCQGRKTHDCQGRSLVERVFQCDVIWTRKHNFVKVGR